MRKALGIITAVLAALCLMACDPCPYHGHEKVQISHEGFTVSAVESIGSLLKLEDASWNEEDGTFLVSLDYGVVAHDALLSIHVDGIEIATMGTPITFDSVETPQGRDFTFTGMPEGRHIVLISLYADGSAMSTGSIELEVEVPYTMTLG